MRLLSFALLICLIPSLAHAEGPLRERLKERLKERSARHETNIGTQITQAGDYTFTLSHGGLTRTYMVHVPRRYNPRVASPLLFAFHGGGGSMEYMAKDAAYGLTPKAEQENFIVVYPNGYSKLPSGKFATWNAGTCCGDARDKNIDDVGFVRAMLAQLMKQVNIDRNRIYATGMSNGGMMAQRLACEMADTFKAVASVAGTDNTVTCTPARPISVLHIHAKDDTHVLFNGGAGKDVFRDVSKVTNFTSVPETISRWRERDRCASTPTRVVNVKGAYCDLYASCAGGTQVQLCVTETGGHSWPGGTKPRADIPPSKAISANDEMWKFFSSLD